MIMLMAFTALNSVAVISCRSPIEREEEIRKIDNDSTMESNEVIQNYLADIEEFRKEMDNTTESNIQNLSLIRARIKYDNKKVNSGFTTTIFKLEMACGYMNMKLKDYKPIGEDKWKIFKFEFSKEMDDLNGGIRDFDIAVGRINGKKINNLNTSKCI